MDAIMRWSAHMQQVRGLMFATAASGQDMMDVMRRVPKLRLRAAELQSERLGYLAESARPFPHQHLAQLPLPRLSFRAPAPSCDPLPRFLLPVSDRFERRGLQPGP